MAKDYAPGLPSRDNYGDIGILPVDDVATLVRQRHKADRAGLHEDLRIGTPSGLLSWAVPKELPEGPEKRLAVRQPVHTWSYKDFQGRLGHGYGKGTVEKVEETPVVILKRSPSHIMFTRGDRKNAPIYNLVQTRDKNWLLSIKQENQPAQIKSYSKEHFKSIPIDDVAALISTGSAISPKIDGAGALAYLGKGGISVYGIRNDKRGLKPEYTDYIGGLRGVQVPKDLRGTILRGEVYGEQQGRSIPPNELAGILNSNLTTAVNKRRADGIKLLLGALAVNKDGTDIYDPLAIQLITKRLGAQPIVAIPTYKGQDALRLLSSIRSGQLPLTGEGVVVHQAGKRPVKAKLTDDYDVVIDNIFPAQTQTGTRAGGFHYSIPNTRKTVGKVGTGFTHVMLSDMLRNPKNYIGRTARISAQGQYPSGAYRAPVFISLKED